MVHKETIDKTLKFLTELLDKHKSEYFSAYDSLDKLKLSKNIMQSMVQMKLVQRISKGKYIPLFTQIQIEPILARRICEHTNQNIKTKKGLPLKQEPSISIFSDKELFDELKLRGYKGEIHKTQSFNL